MRRLEVNSVSFWCTADSSLVADMNDSAWKRAEHIRSKRDIARPWRVGQRGDEAAAS